MFTQIQEKPLLTPKEVASIYPCSTSWLEKRRIDGDGPKFGRYGRKIFYRKEELDAYFARQEFSSTAEYRKAAN
ncbi:MAG: helix-turn-helix domain-containing protein [Cyanobacteria bacterium SZAS LIN-3]|nr:helix-turn-helix domain-containing protein [Cyanobacteria bacterium SZAS LIN-3]